MLWGRSHHHIVLKKSPEFNEASVNTDQPRSQKSCMRPEGNLSAGSCHSHGSNDKEKVSDILKREETIGKP